MNKKPIIPDSTRGGLIVSISAFVIWIMSTMFAVTLVQWIYWVETHGAEIIRTVFMSILKENPLIVIGLPVLMTLVICLMLFRNKNL